jgi:hypothetical protein
VNNLPSARRDSVREEAYTWAMELLAGRLGVSDSLTTEQREALRAYDGPEIAGNRSKAPKR